GSHPPLAVWATCQQKGHLQRQRDQVTDQQPRQEAGILPKVWNPPQKGKPRQQHAEDAQAGPAQDRRQLLLGRLLEGVRTPQQRQARRQKTEKDGGTGVDDGGIARVPVVRQHAERQGSEQPEQQRAANQEKNTPHHRESCRDFESLSSKRLSKRTRCHSPPTSPSTAPATTPHGAQRSHRSRNTPRTIGSTISRPTWASAK